MNFDQGEILVLELPFSNMKASKLRPVLVVSNVGYNNLGNDIIVAKITGSKYNTPWETVLTNKDLSFGKLKKSSYVDSGFIFTIEKTLIKKSIGKINNTHLNVIIKKIRQILDKK